MPVAEDVIIARGHVNIRATNRRTLEITKDPYVTSRGDCIVACCADKAGPDLSQEVLALLRLRGNVMVEIEVGGLSEIIIGKTPMAEPRNPYRLVIRKSNYVDDSTLAVQADKSAADLPRPLVSLLRKGIIVRVKVRVWTYEGF
ncbi:DUF371 domain-containing protein [Thermoproteus tenax]|uniref:DUF371 domain-containing protein n=1 Tax=Thermoproteus tenax (strain ATCC 35583 / DSM 2078 / JCM 9277 / NBRC 100435 / Kra 1) TaxID=768679 RepID=G4RKZ8_THETK|nr:DUF371 domain-containing protein [Thermoproteus tenax]CCC82243.1 conserved hypothetical protein [Thermoproteus tenax Kra 1]